MLTILGHDAERGPTPETYERLMPLLEGLSAQAPGAPYETWAWLLDQLDLLFDGHGASVGFAVRVGEGSTTQAPGLVHGWTPGYFLYGKDPEHRAQMLLDLIRSREFATDEKLHEQLRLAGHVRVFLVRSADEGSPLPGGFEGAIFRRLQLVDRMVLHKPLTSHLEGAILVDRQKPPVFSPQDAEVLLLLQRFLTAPLRALARACGYLDASEPLTPRERDVLRLLLTAASKKDIADALSMTAGALHQRVKRVYAKFRVTSRAELMALWLRPQDP